MDSEMATLNAKNGEKPSPKNQYDGSSKESVENGSGNNNCTVTTELPGYSLAEDSDIHGLKPVSETKIVDHKSTTATGVRLYTY